MLPPTARNSVVPDTLVEKGWSVPALRMAGVPSRVSSAKPVQDYIFDRASESWF